VAIRYRLYRPGELVFEERIETRAAAPGQTITRAALDAMAMTNEKLVRVLARETGALPAQPRRVPLRVLDGCKLGPRGVERLVAELDDVYEREARLGFDARREEWRAPAFDAAVGPALRLEPPAGGILLALAPSAQGAAAAGVRFGVAATLGRHVVLGCPEPGRVPSVTAIHELAHLLGGVHVNDRSSVMNPVAEFDARFFDPLNRRILLTTRERPFGAPLPPEMSAQLAAIYRAAGRFPERVNARDLEAALEALARASH
jgi:hypothetical protein